jgi:hypothetical protein
MVSVFADKKLAAGPHRHYDLQHKVGFEDRSISRMTFRASNLSIQLFRFSPGTTCICDFWGDTDLASVPYKEEIAIFLVLIARRVEMTSDEELQLEQRSCQCQSTSLSRLTSLLCAHERIVNKCSLGNAIHQVTLRAVDSPFKSGRTSECEMWIAAHIRTRLRVMAGDAFSISRHTTDFLIQFLYARFLSDTDAGVQRMLDLVALRYAYDGSNTVTLEDVRVALCPFAPPR